MSKSSNFPKSKIVSTNNIDIEVFEAGCENRTKPIVLCHGWPEHAYSWRHQIPALVAAGYHVIVPNQRGYGLSSCPNEVTDYDISCLTGDLVGILDHYGYEQATFVGHDWGAMVVWGMSLLHPKRVKSIINLSLPYQERGELPWLSMMEQFLGEDYYFVHFNKYPGVADKVLDANRHRFLKNLYRKDEAPSLPEPGMMMINLAKTETAKGVPIMADEHLTVFVSSFEKTGFTPSINWYRNLDRNWHLLGEVHPIVEHPTLMIYGKRDLIPQPEAMSKFVPKLDEVSLDCGHWIQQELPEETNQVILKWLQHQ